MLYGISACIWNWPSRGGEDREASQASLGGEGARLFAPAPTIGIGGGSELDAEGARKGEGGERTRVGVVGVGIVEGAVELAEAVLGGKSASLGRLAGARRTYEGGATTLLATSYVETEP